MTKAGKFILSLFAYLFVLLPLAGQAADQPPRLAEMWTMTPKADDSAAFWEGMEAHMKFRTEAGDPRTWKGYTPLLGENLSMFAVRFCCFNWADADAHREWDKNNPEVNKHFNEHVAPHVESWGHYIDEVSWVNSNIKRDWGPYRLFGATEFKLKPGMAGQFDEVRDKISQIALNQGWATPEHPWIWASSVGGEPSETIVIPYRNYAEMDRDEETFFNFLSRVMGSDEAAEELFQKMAASIESQSYQIWELQEEVSMKDPD